MSHLAGHARLLEELGAPVGRLLRRARLPLLSLDDPGAFVSSHLLHGFLDLGRPGQGFDDLGLRAASRLALADIPWTAGALRSGTTLGDALNQFVLLASGESSAMKVWLRPAGERIWVCHRGSMAPRAAGDATSEQYTLVLLVRFVEAALGRRWSPREIRLRASDTLAVRASELARGARVNGGFVDTAIAVPWALLWEPVVSELQSDAESPAPAQGFVDALRQALTPYLPEGLPSVEAAAELSGFSLRTLQRRLGAAGLPYSALADGLRRDRALALVRAGQMPLADVAGQLGFHDPAHFTRSFRRWTGCTPSAFRRGLGGGGGDERSAPPPLIA